LDARPDSKRRVPVELFGEIDTLTSRLSSFRPSAYTGRPVQGAAYLRVKNQVNMGRIRKFFHDAGRLKPYYRVCSNVASGLGIVIGIGLWYFTLVPLLAASLEIDVTESAQSGDPTAFFAVTMVLLLVVSMIICIQGVFFALVLLGRLRFADVTSVIWHLRYPRSWTNF